MAAADLKSVTAEGKNQPELFNDDVTLLDAMKTALGISEAAKSQQFVIVPPKGFLLSHPPTH
jgi:hypothetical protein